MVQIRIGNISWSVYAVNRDSEKLQRSDDEAVMGITYFQEAEIYICTERTSADILRRTILHELCHAALFSRGFTPSGMDEEDICNFFESNAIELCAKAQEVYNALTDEAQAGAGTEALLGRVYTAQRPAMA